MMENVKLFDLITLQRGFDITKKEQVSGKVPVISSGGISSFHNEYKVKGPGVVIGRKGTLGTVFYTEKDFWPHDTSLWVKDFKGNDPKFIYYFLQVLHFERFDAGAANPTLNRNHIHSLKLTVPAKESRPKIAAILSAYDDLIENNNQRIQLLEEMAEEIYKEWFVRLRFPGYESCTFYDKEGNVVPHGTAGALPEGWEHSPIDSILEKVKRKPKVGKDDYLETGQIPVIDQGDGLVGGYVNDNKFLQNSPLPLLVFGDHTRRVKFVDFPFASGADGTQLLHPKNKDLLPTFFYLAVKRIDLSNFHYARHFKYLRRESILIPSGDTLRAFNELTAPFLKEMDILSNKNQVLQETRDLLLPRLISGKLDVAQLEIEEPSTS